MVVRGQATAAPHSAETTVDSVVEADLAADTLAADLAVADTVVASAVVDMAVASAAADTRVADIDNSH
jgi:hypothetical protein